MVNKKKLKNNNFIRYKSYKYHAKNLNKKNNYYRHYKNILYFQQMTIIHLFENINNNNNFAKKVNYPFNNIFNTFI